MIYTEKSEVSSLAPDFYPFKYIYAVIVKENEDITIVNFPGFFL